MITEETVFIIGAGGSALYGFPTGEQLSQLIIGHFPEAYRQLIRQSHITDRAKIDELSQHVDCLQLLRNHL